MPKININDVSLYYESYGSGAPIVFITGFNTDHLIWQNIIETYAKNFRVIVFDNRGAGEVVMRFLAKYNIS
jgi:pimeloyl-ACP methyl ester carboxylesterase